MGHIRRAGVYFLGCCACPSTRGGGGFVGVPIGTERGGTSLLLEQPCRQTTMAASPKTPTVTHCFSLNDLFIMFAAPDSLVSCRTRVLVSRPHVVDGGYVRGVELYHLHVTVHKRDGMPAGVSRMLWREVPVPTVDAAILIDTVRVRRELLA